MKLYKVWWSYTSVYTRTVRIPQGRLRLVLRGVRVDGILAGGLAKLALLLHAGVVGDLANDLLRLADELVGNRGMACRRVVTTSVVSGRRIASVGGEACKVIRIVSQAVGVRKMQGDNIPSRLLSSPYVLSRLLSVPYEVLLSSRLLSVPNEVSRLLSEPYVVSRVLSSPYEVSRLVSVP